MVDRRLRHEEEHDVECSDDGHSDVGDGAVRDEGPDAVHQQEAKHHEYLEEGTQRATDFILEKIFLALTYAFCGPYSMLTVVVIKKKQRTYIHICTYVDFLVILKKDKETFPIFSNI